MAFWVHLSKIKQNADYWKKYDYEICFPLWNPWANQSNNRSRAEKEEEEEEEEALLFPWIYGLGKKNNRHPPLLF